MKRKLMSLILALALCLSMAPAAWAYSDKVFSQDTTLPGQMGFNYDNVVVKAGVTVTFRDFGRDPQSIWVYKSLTVEPGGRLVGGSIAFLEGATYSGMDFYYKVQEEEVRLAPENLAVLIADDPEKRQVFNWNSATGHYVRAGDGAFNTDPFFDPNAVEDVTFSVTTDLTGRQTAQWGAAVVKAGATVTLSEVYGTQHVRKSLTVEPGGAVKGGQLAIFYGATVTGLQLYYKTGGEIKEVPGNDLSPVWGNNSDSENRIHFEYDAATGRYIMQGEFESDPFATPQPGPGDPGTNGGVDDRTLTIARGLKSLGLFKGVVDDAVTAEDFALSAAPTREQAVILLIRLLGKDAEASAYPAEKCPFTDVDVWAKSYLAYAYDTGLTKGVDPANGVFGMGDATPQQFLTFALRALGYRDDTQGGTDFTYAGAVDFAMANGLVGGEGDLQNFTRGVCVRIMEAALRQATTEHVRLYEKLSADGVFTEEQYHAVMDGV